MFELEACTLCSLGQNGSNLVLGDDQRAFDHHPIIFFLGEAPGRDEDRVGVPFVGRAGKLLRKCIETAGIESFYISNVCYCRPPDNRNPTPKEIDFCGHYTLLEIEHVAPDLIVAVGKVATEFLSRFSRSHHDPWKDKELLMRNPVSGYEYWVRVVYHPAYILRNPQQKGAYQKSINEVLKIATEITEDFEE